MSEPPERRPIRYVDVAAALPRDGVPILDGGAALDLLATARRIAVVGASPSPWRPSHSVMGYLLTHGYDCVPVNPEVDRVLGHRSYPSLEAAVEATGEPFDIVDVFRRPEFAPDIARSAVATRCRALWLQLGVISWEAAAIASDGGLAVVMDRCAAVDHRALRTRTQSSAGPESMARGDQGA